jgi:hypothetical protein
MSITTRDQLIDAMANNSSRIVINKASPGNTGAGVFQSYWKSTGQPGVGVTPTTVATCNHTTVGAIGFTQQIDPSKSYIGLFEYATSVAGQTVEIHDRIAHMGGLNATLTTAQTVNLDLNTLLGTDNIAARIGDSNYSDVLFNLEWYANSGGTAVNATVNVTFNDGTTGNLGTLALIATRTTGVMYQLNGLIQAANAGKYIRGVNTVTLSASTGAAGNFGVTVTRYRCGGFAPAANARYSQDWAQLGLPEVLNSSCLFPVQLPSAASNGSILATGKIVHG